MSPISVVQFEASQQGRRLGVISNSEVIDITAAEPQICRVIDAHRFAASHGTPLAKFLSRFGIDRAMNAVLAANFSNRCSP